jgi:hypothetical protein
MCRQHRIVQSQPQAGHDRQRSVDDISFVRMLEAWLRTVGTEHKHHSNISTAPSGEIRGGPGHDNPRQPQCRALHYLAGSPPQDRQTFSSQEGDV